MVFRVRKLLVRQRTQIINALRGHLGEDGQVVPSGKSNASRLVALVGNPNSGLPADAVPVLKILAASLAQLNE